MTVAFRGRGCSRKQIECAKVGGGRGEVNLSKQKSTISAKT